MTLGTVTPLKGVELDDDWAKAIVRKQRAYFKCGATRDYEFRMAQLGKLKDAVVKYRDEMLDCLKEDIGRPPMEGFIEYLGVIEELNHTSKNLKSWMKPKKVKTALSAQPATSRIEYGPKGVTFVIGPYNYPYYLVMLPLVGALAAGNTVIIKPSSLNPKTSALIAKIIGECFSEEYIRVFEGSSTITTALTAQPLDHIFFTGSPRVGRIVMAAAAQHLTPVTLELGGKSPAIVHKDCDIKIAAKRIMWGKSLNVGQTCVAPDYVLVHSSIKEQFMAECKAYLKRSYGDNPKSSPDLGRIINEKQFDRVSRLIKEDSIYCGGQTDRDELFIAPTLLKDISLDDDIMKEEIFGPVLPILSYEEMDEVINTVDKLPQHPLALYVFTSSEEVENFFVSNIQFGGGCINNTILHVGNGNMPFGGIGESGMGGYHGHYSFRTFSHEKSILKTPTWANIPLIFPPYKNKVKILKMLVK